jgi:hypothetical protein
MELSKYKKLSELERTRLALQTLAGVAAVQDSFTPEDASLLKRESEEIRRELLQLKSKLLVGSPKSRMKKAATLGAAASKISKRRA